MSVLVALYLFFEGRIFLVMLALSGGWMAALLLHFLFPKEEETQ